MQPEDPNFGAGFSADLFRSGIRNAMMMGLPQNSEERVTFRWTVKRTYGVADSSGMPFNFSDAPATEETKADVQVPAAVEFVGSTTDSGTSIGAFQTPRAVITVLDVDYPQVEGADQVVLGGNTYQIDYVAPPLGLFDVSIYQIHCQAKDES